MKLLRYSQSLLVATVIALGCNQAGAMPPAATTTNAVVKLPAGHPDIGEPKSALPSGHPNIDMSTQQLPPGTTAGDATNPQWVVPKDWQPGKTSSMRRASFAVTGAEIAVTVFPGDVGGLLANLNRWRGQIGLEPTTAEKLADLTQKLTVNGVAATVVDIANDATGKRMLVATIPQGGNSWFFKITGDKPLVEAQKAAFLDFVKSVKF